MQIKPTFRFFGSFALLPPGKSADPVPSSATLVEFFVTHEDGESHWKTFVRASAWTGGALPAPPEDLGSVEMSLFDDATAVVNALSALGSGETVSFWAFAEKGSIDPEIGFLRMLGAVAVDQFEVAETISRFPLLRTEGDGTLVPTIRFGNDDDGSTRLTFRLQNPRAGEPRPIAFEAIYDSYINASAMAGNPARAIRPTNFVLGSKVRKVRGPVGHFGFASIGQLADSYGAPASFRPDHRPLWAALDLGPAVDWTAYVIETKGGSEDYSVATTMRAKPPRALDLFDPGDPTVPVSDTRSLWLQAIATVTVEEAALAEAAREGTEVALKWRWQVRLWFTTRSRSGELLSRAGLVTANAMAKNARDGLLATVRQPQSVLPAVLNRTTQFKMTAELAKDTLSQDAQSRFQVDRPAYFISPETRTEEVLAALGAPGDRPWRWTTRPASPYRVAVELPSLEDPSERFTAWPLDLGHGGDGGQFDDAASKIVFAVTDPGEAQEPLAFRLGSLRFRGVEGTLLGKAKGRIEIAPLRRGQPDTRPAAEGVPLLAVTWDLPLALSDARAVTPDITAVTRRDDDAVDILIPERVEDASAGEQRFRLRLTETLRDDQDRRLQARLFDIAPDDHDAADAPMTVLSDAPFSAYRFARRSLARAGDADGAAVADFDSDTGQWLWLRDGRDYRFVLPAGATGEDADKPGMLELHDGDESDPPVLPGDGPAARKRVLDMRYGPPSVLWIDPSDLETNYAPPETAARLLFRQRGAFGVGVGLSGLRFEALYGLSLGILVPDPRDSGDPNPPRVAELDVLAGRMLPAGRVGGRWPQLRAALRHRPERLELWRLDPGTRNAFQPARFDEGVTAALRRTARLAPPVNEPRVQPDPNEPDAPQPPAFDDEIGLRGGVLWPMESANGARLVAEAVIATSARVDSVSLAPSGVTAAVETEFLDGLVKIVSETVDGRLQRQRVEVLGRIAALWHRAKHVVIYERTTAASDQFVADGEGGTRTKRPVLRKVSEFVEILEPVRRYPDVPEADPKAASFLEEVRFNSRIIPVNGAWGRDLGADAWEVPLWQRGEAEMRPQVYPFPDIGFVTRAEGETESAQTAQDCLDPHLLNFFTDFTQAAPTGGTIDTDTWPVRYGVDTNLAASGTLVQKTVATLEDVGADDAQRKSLPSRVLPGLRRFTCRLAASPVRTRINAAQGERPVFSGLESITFARPSGEPELGASSDDFEGALGALVAPESGVAIGLPNAIAARPAAVGDGKITALAAGLSALEDAEADGRDDDKETAIAAIKGAIGEPDDDLSGTATKIADRLLGDVADVKNMANRLDNPLARAIRDADVQTCRNLEAQFLSSLKRRELLILDEVRSFTTEWRAKIEALPADDWSKENVKQALKAELSRTTAVLTGELALALDDARDGVATARAIVADWRSDARAAILRGKARFAEARAAIDRDLPWSEARLSRVLDQYDTAVGRAERAGQEALAELRQRLSSEITGTSRTIGAILAGTMADVQEAEASLGGDLGSFSEIVRTQAQTQTAKIEAWAPELKAALEDVVARAKASGNQNLNNAALALQAAFPETEINKAKETIVESLETFEEVTEETLAAVRDRARAMADEVEAKLTALSADVAEIEAQAQAFVDAGSATLGAEVGALARALRRGPDGFDDFLSQAKTMWKDADEVLDAVVKEHAARLDAALDTVETAAEAGLRAADQWVDRLADQREEARKTLPQAAASALDALLGQAVDRLIDPLPWPDDLEERRAETRKALTALEAEALAVLRQASSVGVEGLAELRTACQALVGAKDALFDEVETYKQRYVEQIKKELGLKLEALREAVAGGAESATAILEAGNEVWESVDALGTELAVARDHARSYLNAGLERAQDVLSARPSALPGRALELVSFLSTAPEIAALRMRADRARIYVDKIENALKTPAIESTINYLGDALKALGLRFDVNTIRDTIQMASPNLDRFDFRDFCPSFAGLDLGDMLKNTRLDDDVFENVTLSHDVDLKQGRAWVRLDMDVDLPGRHKLFALGPFTAYLKDSRLQAFLQADASKDQDEVRVTDFALLTTDLEAVVGGQVVVTLEDMELSYSGDTGLDVAVDPSRIKIHKSLRFVEDVLGGLLPDAPGGLEYIRQDGQIVGVGYGLELPPISANFGTSGIQNLQIANHFALTAYPDFVIANRFNLSRRELPFIFSIFIIGGTGYVQVDSEYQPSTNALMVAVEAGVGGSAALAFSFGPVSGGVFVTFSVVLRYVKRIGSAARPDDGLSVSLVLVVAGHVSLWGMVTVYLGLMLSMQYHESGRIDGLGQLSVEVRISRWFKLKYSTRVTYRLRDGKSTTVVTDSTSVSGEAIDRVNAAKAKLDQLNQARKSL